MKALRKYVLWVAGYDGIPKMARPTFRYDLLSTMFASMGTGVMLPSLTSQFASGEMETSIWVVGLLFAQRSMGNLVATFFAQDLARRPRVPMVVTARIGIALFMLCIAALPTGQPGIAGSFAALLVTPYLLAALCTNLQSVTRHSNYPVAGRGRIFSRLTVVQMGSLAASALLAGLMLDYLDWGHATAYILSACAMLLSAWSYSKIRIRRERTMLKNGRRHPIRLLAGFRLLREDTVFAQYLCWQMIFGGANMMTHPALTEILKGYMTHYGDRGFGYGWSMVCRVATPLLVVVCVAPLAGRLFDRVKITRFRGLGASMWATSKLLVYFAAGSIVSFPSESALFWIPWAALLIAFAFQGTGQAVGNIAYNLGHMSFTSTDRGHEYMGIHLTFQGVRGVAAPLLGAWLYKIIGTAVLPVAAAAILVAVLGFFLMKPPSSPPVEMARPTP